MILGLLMRVAGLIVLLWCLPIFFIRAQPYDDRDMRAFLLPPDDCPAPCFMGIRPGVTTARETFAILQSHAWVETIWIDGDPVLEQPFNYTAPLPNDLSWSWQPDVPRWLNRNIKGWLNFRRGYVNTMVIDTQLRLGDTLLIMGQPDYFALRTFGTQKEHTFRLTAWYLDAGTVISTGGLCPMRMYDLRVPLIFFSGFQQVEAYDTRRTGC